jgi:hypothetical protein
MNNSDHSLGQVIAIDQLQQKPEPFTPGGHCSGMIHISEQMLKPIWIEYRGCQPSSGQLNVQLKWIIEALAR